MAADVVRQCVHDMGLVCDGFYIRLWACARCAFRLEFHRDPLDLNWYRSGCKPTPDQIAATSITGRPAEPSDFPELKDYGSDN